VIRSVGWNTRRRSSTSKRRTLVDGSTPGLVTLGPLTISVELKLNGATNGEEGDVAAAELLGAWDRSDTTGLYEMREDGRIRWVLGYFEDIEDQAETFPQLGAGRFTATFAVPDGRVRWLD